MTRPFVPLPVDNGVVWIEAAAVTSVSESFEGVFVNVGKSTHKTSLSLDEVFDLIGATHSLS